jgi:nucleoside-diphosphate-sugar epimerase
MKIAITGCCGFLGRNLMEAYPEAHGFDLAEEGNRLFPDRYTETDLLLSEPNLEGFDAVIHLAAMTSVRGTGTTTHSDYIAYNLGITRNVYNAACKHRVPRMFNASSSSVYGDGTTPSKETQPTQPLSEYGLSKAISEMWLDWASRDGFTTVVNMRLFNLLGKYQRSTMLPMLALAAADYDTTLTLFGVRLRAWTPVKQAVSIIQRLITLPVGPRFDAVNVGGTWVCTQEFLLLQLEKLIKRKVPFKYSPNEFPFEALTTQADTTHRKAILGEDVNTTDADIEAALLDVISTYQIENPDFPHL